MKILFVASECAPVLKVGGLGDFIGSLPKVLKDFGLDVRVVIPFPEKIQREKLNFNLISDFYFKKGRILIWQTFLPKTEIPIFLLENKKYLTPGEIYPQINDFKSFRKFLFFSNAILEIFPKIGWEPEVLHCNEWETAFVAPLLKIKNQKLKIKTLLTIHNLSIQGKWNAKEIFQFLNLKGKEIKSLKERDKDGDFNILQQGILNSDILTTVSPTYAKEILTKEYGEGLEEILKKNKRKLFGILNGIDTEIFDPETDKNLKVNYPLKNIEREIENKIELQEILNLPKNPEIPLIGFIGRLIAQKGLDLFEKVIPDLIRLNVEIVFLGIGKEKYEKMLIDFSKKYPKNISTNIKFDSALAQKIYGGCDIILIPSLFEPCGLVQMIAQRYGTIPIARKTGGLADTIEDEKTGFLFERFNPESFLKAIERCLKVFQDKKEWQRMIKKAMAKDFSWKKSAKEYLKLYQKLISQR